MNTLINSAYDSAAYTTIKDTSVIVKGFKGAKKDTAEIDVLVAREKKVGKHSSDHAEIERLLEKYTIRVSKAKASYDYKDLEWS